jgi:hypothetical protein
LPKQPSLNPTKLPMVQQQKPAATDNHEKARVREDNPNVAASPTAKPIPQPTVKPTAEPRRKPTAKPILPPTVTPTKGNLPKLPSRPTSRELPAPLPPPQASFARASSRCSSGEGTIQTSSSSSSSSSWFSSAAAEEAAVLALEGWMKRNGGSAVDNQPAEATAAAVKVNEAIAAGATPTTAFHDSNLLDASASYAVCFTGMVRTWQHSRSFFERTFSHAANGPLDLFVHAYLPAFDHRGDAAGFDQLKDIISKHLLALPRRSLDLERWNLVSLEALRLALDNKHCKAGLATENACTKRELATKIWIPVMSHFRKNLLCWRALQRHVASPARCHKQYDAIVSTRLDLVYPPEVCANL